MLGRQRLNYRIRLSGLHRWDEHIGILHRHKMRIIVNWLVIGIDTKPVIGIIPIVIASRLRIPTHIIGHYRYRERHTTHFASVNRFQLTQQGLHEDIEGIVISCPHRIVTGGSRAQEDTVSFDIIGIGRIVFIRLQSQMMHSFSELRIIRRTQLYRVDTYVPHNRVHTQFKLGIRADCGCKHIDR